MVFPLKRAQTVYRQMPQAGDIAETMTSNGKQFTVTREMLTAVAGDQCWPDVVAGISARFSKFAFHFMTGPLGSIEFFFPRRSRRKHRDSRETKFTVTLARGQSVLTIALMTISLFIGLMFKKG